MPAHRIIVTGHVQGVFFRAEAKEHADDLGLTGWVRNRENGSVEIHVEGTSDAVDQLEAWCKKGPAGARVENILSRAIEEEGCIEFVIRK